MFSSSCRPMVFLWVSDACVSRACRLFSRATSLFSRVTSLRSSPHPVRSDLILSFWFSACSRAARSRRLSLLTDEILLRLLDSTPASDRSFSSRATSACRESASFAVRRTSFVSSAASLSLRRHVSNCHFSELARARESISARRSSSQRASAPSARARSRSYSDRKSRGAHVGAVSGDEQISSSPSTSARSAPKSSSRISMRSTIAHGRSRYQ